MYEKELASALANVAVRRGAKGFTFDDLAPGARLHRGTISAVADWLADARSVGFVEELGFDPGLGPDRLGPRRYRLSGASSSRHGQLRDDATG